MKNDCPINIERFIFIARHSLPLPEAAAALAVNDFSDKSSIQSISSLPITQNPLIAAATHSPTLISHGRENQKSASKGILIALLQLPSLLIIPLILHALGLL